MLCPFLWPANRITYAQHQPAAYDCRGAGMPPSITREGSMLHIASDFCADSRMRETRAYRRPRDIDANIAPVTVVHSPNLRIVAPECVHAIQRTT